MRMATPAGSALTRSWEKAEKLAQNERTRRDPATIEALRIAKEYGDSAATVAAATAAEEANCFRNWALLKTFPVETIPFMCSGPS